MHTNADGTVTIDGETFSSWKEAHDKLDHHGKHFHTKLGRAWNEFPFPALVVLAYLVLGIIYGTWAMGLFLVFLIPVYYAIGDFIDRRHLSKLVEDIYPAAALAWFLYMWLCLDSPIPHGSFSSRSQLQRRSCSGAANNGNIASGPRSLQPVSIAQPTPFAPSKLR